MNKILQNMIKELEDTELKLRDESYDIECTIGIINAISAAKKVVKNASEAMHEHDKEIREKTVDEFVQNATYHMEYIQYPLNETDIARIAEKIKEADFATLETEAEEER